MAESEREPPNKALRWLGSHLNRLKLERKSLEKKLDALSAEIDRVADELKIAERRRRGAG